MSWKEYYHVAPEIILGEANGMLEWCNLIVKAATLLPGAGDTLIATKSRLVHDMCELSRSMPTWQGELASILWSFTNALSDGEVADEDLVELATYSGEVLYRALEDYCSHIEVGKQLAHLIGEAYYMDCPRGRRGYLNGRGGTLVVLVRAGVLLSSLVELDPHLTVAGPGILSYLERMEIGEENAGWIEIMAEIMDTLRRLRGKGAAEMDFATVGEAL
jgi:hypothetical protein